MPRKPAQPAPLTDRQVRRLKPIRGRKEKAAKTTITLGTFKLPKGAKTRIVKAPGRLNAIQLQATIQTTALEHRIPFERIPMVKLSKSKLAAKDMKALALDGLRPVERTLKFIPERIRLRHSDRAQPPAGFKFKRGINRATNVFVPDQRYIYRDTDFPWCTVGRVDSPRGWGTGCTIGSRLLLTANHVIQWNADGTAGWVRFRPAFYNGSAPFGEAWATRVIFWIRTTPADGLTDFETAFDYVVCVLDRRMGNTVGYPGYRTYSSGWNGGTYWQHMGYPQDLTGGQRPAFQGSCIISSTSSKSTSGRTGYVLGHFNDVVGGHSGGPVWGWWSNEPWPRVVGTQSAESASPGYSTAGDNEFGGGPALSALISWARSHYA